MLLTIVNTMSVLFFSLYAYIFTNYYIWKCTQTMLTLLQHCQQQSTSCLFFLPFSLWLSTYVCINCHIRKYAQTTWTVHHHCQQQCLSIYSFSSFYPWLCNYICTNYHNSSAIPFWSIPGTVLVKLLEYQNSVTGVKFWLVNSSGMTPEFAGMTGIWQEQVGCH